MVIDPLSWRADIFAISIISAFVLALILLILVGICWYAKSKHRHAQRLQRRNSIRQSLRSLNSIDPQGSLRRRNFVWFHWFFVSLFFDFILIFFFFFILFSLFFYLEHVQLNGYPDKKYGPGL